TAPLLERTIAALASEPRWDAPTIHQAIQGVAESSGVTLGKVAQPVRVAVSGGTVSPPIDQTLEILGRDETMSRLSYAPTRGGSLKQRLSWLVAAGAAPRDAAGAVPRAQDRTRSRWPCGPTQAASP